MDISPAEAEEALDTIQFMAEKTRHSIASGGTYISLIVTGIIWLLLAVYCIAAIAVAWPIDGKQLTVFIVLFVLVGYLSMGLLLSIISVWPGLIIIALLLVGYFLLPGFFFLWMSILGGGGMVALGLVIHFRW